MQSVSDSFEKMPGSVPEQVTTTREDRSEDDVKGDALKGKSYLVSLECARADCVAGSAGAMNASEAPKGTTIAQGTPQSLALLDET